MNWTLFLRTGRLTATLLSVIPTWFVAPPERQSDMPQRVISTVVQTSESVLQLEVLLQR
jgi:hypothetical protein